MTTATIEKNGKSKIEALAQVTNQVESAIDSSAPYDIEVQITGDAPIIFHAFNCDVVDENSKSSSKGAKSKKTDNVESYVYRTDDGLLGLPGLMLHASIVAAARFHKDPRSPRKSAMDLMKAAIIPLDNVSPFEPKRKDWDYLDRRRAVIQRSGIIRVRPALMVGWKISFRLRIVLADYLTQEWLRKLITDAGQFCGVGDFRPTFGRYSTTGFKVL